MCFPGAPLRLIHYRLGLAKGQTDAGPLVWAAEHQGVRFSGGIGFAPRRVGELAVGPDVGLQTREVHDDSSESTILF
jgi:hypothetical protein